MLRGTQAIGLGSREPLAIPEHRYRTGSSKQQDQAQHPPVTSAGTLGEKGGEPPTGNKVASGSGVPPRVVASVQSALAGWPKTPVPLLVVAINVIVKLEALESKPAPKTKSKVNNREL